MKIYHVVAMARNRVIGKDNKLPWHYSSDLKHFKQLTMGNTVIMGRKTFESIGKPLPGRENFVLSRNRAAGIAAPRLSGARNDRSNLQIEFFQLFNAIDDAIRSAKNEKIFIIGGAELYRQTIHQVDGIYLTHIDADYEGDAFYPEIPPSFKEKSRTLLQDNPKIEVICYENKK